ncbi:MBOAT family O-acyltransferase [Selenomonas sp. KH1T6]|uniref:MBOAT family O-acyltransferase n=1 Tax=Selenomonas sp. KH1T6 TaxID=3158784 RepID=UPI0008A73807|nr:D-alanyl-lipoteichoic acid acyltransferase DltB, MBOAT superfamily [Selenomonas ruminantium]
MLFNSYSFIFAFLPVTLVVYFLLGRFREGKFSNGWLALASLFFYGYWDIRFLPLLVGSILVNYILGGRIAKARASGGKKAGRGYFAAGMVFNLGLLCWFKYMDFLIGSIDRFMGLDLPLLHIMLPLGISFFSITQLVYLIGIYFYNEGKGERDFVDYALFVSFFPHLLAGPILYHKPMMKQLRDSRLKSPQAENFARGIALFSIGLFKKVIIADPFIAPVAAGFGNAAGLSALDAWVLAAAYALQLFFDFSGYSDMAVGAARMLNIDIPVNFRAPFRAASLSEFWSRWHMSLTMTIMSYIYTPMIRMRKKLTLAWGIFSTMVTMTIIGIWHGSGGTFVLFGLLQGVGLSLNQVWKHYHLPFPKVLGHILTLAFVAFSCVLFRADNLGQAFQVYKAMLGRGGGTSHLVDWGPDQLIIVWGGAPFTYLPADLWVPVLAVLLIIYCPESNELVKKYFRPNLRWALALAVMFVYSVLHFTQVTAFLYFQF